MSLVRFNCLLVILTTTITGCNGAGPDLPIARDELPAVMLDVYVAEVGAEASGADKLAARTEALQRHGYDIDDYRLTMTLLVQEPEYAKAVYQSVLDSAIVEQREIHARLLVDSTLQTN